MAPVHQAPKAEVVTVTRPPITRQEFQQFPDADWTATASSEHGQNFTGANIGFVVGLALRFRPRCNNGFQNCHQPKYAHGRL
jgi:hypothetical protein